MAPRQVRAARQEASREGFIHYTKGSKWAVPQYAVVLDKNTDNQSKSNPDRLALASAVGTVDEIINGSPGTFDTGFINGSPGTTKTKITTEQIPTSPPGRTAIDKGDAPAERGFSKCERETERPAPNEVTRDRPSEGPYDKFIGDCWEALGLPWPPHDSRFPSEHRKYKARYSSMLEAIEAHAPDFDRCREYIAYLRGNPQEVPTVTPVWPWFVEKIRTAMTRPWEWKSRLENEMWR